MLMLVMIAGCFTVVSWGASGNTKRMKVYEECIKKGNIVYCATDNGIYKVNIKNGKKTKLFKYSNGYNGDPAWARGIDCIKLHKGYLYYVLINSDLKMNICRVKTSGKARKHLASFYSGEFAISGKRIYYKGFRDWEYTKAFKKKMKLNGKSKSNSSYNVKMKYAVSNAKGYRIVEKYIKSGLEKNYLKLPSGKVIYLETVDYDGGSA